MKQCFDLRFGRYNRSKQKCNVTKNVEYENYCIVDLGKSNIIHASVNGFGQYKLLLHDSENTPC